MDWFLDIERNSENGLWWQIDGTPVGKDANGYDRENSIMNNPYHWTRVELYFPIEKGKAFTP